MTSLTSLAPTKGSVDHSTQHLGWFRFYFDNDRWTWSAQVEHMHGYKPKTTAPSTLLFLSHVHLDDFHRVAEALQDARRSQHPFSVRYRILDTGHHLHHVVMVGAPFYDTEGAVAGMQGFCVDVTTIAKSNGHTTLGADGSAPHECLANQSACIASRPIAGNCGVPGSSSR